MSVVTVLQPFHWLSSLEVSLICHFALAFPQYLFISLASAVNTLLGLLTSAMMSAEAAGPVSVAPFRSAPVMVPIGVPAIAIQAEPDSRANSQLQSAAVTDCFQETRSELRQSNRRTS